MLLAMTQCQCQFNFTWHCIIFVGQKHSGKVRTYYAVWICLFYAKPYGVLVHSFSEYKERRIIQTCLIRFLFTNVLALTFIVC